MDAGQNNLNGHQCIQTDLVEKEEKTYIGKYGQDPAQAIVLPQKISGEQAKNNR